MKRQCWLVHRDYDDRNLVNLVYATPDGEQAHRRELSATLLSNTTVTAARDVEEAKLRPVEDDEQQKRYATEAKRMADEHDPDEPI